MDAISSFGENLPDPIHSTPTAATSHEGIEQHQSTSDIIQHAFVGPGWWSMD